MARDAVHMWRAALAYGTVFTYVGFISPNAGRYKLIPAQVREPALVSGPNASA